jgi:hypothetical protein
MTSFPKSPIVLRMERERAMRRSDAIRKVEVHPKFEKIDISQEAYNRSINILPYDFKIKDTVPHSEREEEKTPLRAQVDLVEGVNEDYESSEEEEDNDEYFEAEEGDASQLRSDHPPLDQEDDEDYETSEYDSSEDDDSKDLGSQMVVEGYGVVGMTTEKLELLKQMSALSYSSDRSGMKIAQFERLSSQKYTILNFPKKAASPDAMMFAKGDDIYISYAGTQNLKGAVIDGNVQMRSPLQINCPEGLVHQGFYDSVLDTWDSILKAINDHCLAAKKSIFEMNIHFSGHSLGGASAMIAATIFSNHFTKLSAFKMDNLYLVTFASPRVFNSAIVNYCKEMGLSYRTIRVISDIDITHDAIPGFYGYAHMGLYKLINRSEQKGILSYLMAHKLADFNNMDQQAIIHTTKENGFGGLVSAVTSWVRSSVPDMVREKSFSFEGLKDSCPEMFIQEEDNLVVPFEGLLEDVVQEMDEVLEGVPARDIYLALPPINTEGTIILPQEILPEGATKEDLSLYFSSSESFKANFDQNLEKTVNFINRDCKIVDSFVDGARFIMEPTFKNAFDLSLDISYFAVPYNPYLRIMMPVKIVSDVAQGEYMKAGSEALVWSFYMGSTYMITSYTGIPGEYIINPALSLYTIYNSANNIASFSEELSNKKYPLKSMLAYKDMFEYLSETPLQSIYDFESSSREYQLKIDDFSQDYSKFLREKLKDHGYIACKKIGHAPVQYHLKEEYHCFNEGLEIVDHVFIGDNGDIEVI